MNTIGILNTLQWACVQTFGNEEQLPNREKMKKKKKIGDRCRIATSITYTSGKICDSLVTPPPFLSLSRSLSVSLSLSFSFICQFQHSACFHTKPNEVRDAIDCVGYC